MKDKTTINPPTKATKARPRRKPRIAARGRRHTAQIYWFEMERLKRLGLR
jgi:hypothetical protein